MQHLLRGRRSKPSKFPPAERPMSGVLKLSAIYLFFAILGGVKAFGLIGLLLGPVVLSVLLVLVGILRHELNEWAPPSNASHAGSPTENVPIAGADAGEFAARNWP